MIEVEFVEVDWMRAVKVWWSLLWRSVLFSFLAGAAIGFIIGFFMGIFKAEQETVKTVSAIAGYIIAIPVGIAVVKHVLSKRYSDFKIALIKEKH